MQVCMWTVIHESVCTGDWMYVCMHVYMYGWVDIGKTA